MTSPTGPVTPTMQAVVLAGATTFLVVTLTAALFGLGRQFLLAAALIALLVAGTLHERRHTPHGGKPAMTRPQLDHSIPAAVITRFRLLRNPR